MKWRTGGPRHLGASGHRDQKQGHIKTPAQHDTMRAHEILLLFLYLFISRPYPDFSNGGATLFLADADYERYEKAKWTRRYLLGHRRILKKGRLYHTPRKSNFSKGKRRLEMQYFKTAVLRPKAEQNGLVVYASAECYQKKKADKPCAC